MKKITVTVLAIIMLLGLTACGTPYSDYDLEEYIMLGEYKGLEVASYEINITDEDVDKEIDLRLSAAASTETVTEGTVAEGDTITITYSGTIDGVPFEGGSQENASLIVGSHQMIDGFEEGLIGATIGGDPVVLDLTFPEGYQNADLAGKDAQFTVTVSSKSVSVKPELNMDFITSTGSTATSVEEYREEIRQHLYDFEEKAAILEQKQELWNTVVENSTVITDADGNEKYPEKELDRVYNIYLDQYKDYAKQYGMEYDEFIMQTMQMDTATFEAQVMEYAKVIVKQEEILYYIVDLEGISVSKDEYNQYIEDSLASMGYTEETYESAMGGSFEDVVGEDTIKRYIYIDKVTQLLLDNAVIVDPEPAE